MIKENPKGKAKIMLAAASAFVMTVNGALLPQINAYAEGYAVYPDYGSSGTSSSVITRNNFSRSAEEWAALEDNNLNWEEIPDLIHEYNATVITNRSELEKDERRSMDAEEISEYLMDMADDADADADEAEETSAALAATYRSQADSLRQQANSNLDDYEIIKLSYEQIEKQTALSAKQQFIEYYRALAQDEYNEPNLSYLERLYVSEQNKYNVNMSTELNVLTAKETWENARASAAVNKNSISSNLQSLIVLCGWKYDAEPVIGPLPEMTAEEAVNVDYAADLEKAMANSITLRMDNIRLENAKKMGTSALVSEQETTLKNDTDSFGISFKAAYDSLKTCAEAYVNAVNASANGDRDLEYARRQREMGLISDVELMTAENTKRSLELNVKTAYYDMISARAAYDAAVNDGIL